MNIVILRNDCIVFSYSNFGDTSLNNEKQSKDGDFTDGGEFKPNESHDVSDNHSASGIDGNGGGSGCAGGDNSGGSGIDAGIDASDSDKPTTPRYRQLLS